MDAAILARQWSALLARPEAVPYEELTLAPSPELASELPAALALLAGEALSQGHTLDIVVADDEPLPEISNALDLALRPLCLVLPAAERAGRVAFKATLALLKSRLARAGDETDTTVWRTFHQTLQRRDALWRASLAWLTRDLENETWPPDAPTLFPVRIAPAELALRWPSAASWVLLLDAHRLPADLRSARSGSRMLALAAPFAFAGALRLADAATRQRLELEVLAQELAELELELATTQAELAAFSLRYGQTVGERMARLDELHAQLAERQAAQRPQDATAAEESRQRREQAEHSRHERERLTKPQAPAAPPAAELKKLYRRLAQQIHPDRAASESERAWRTQLMSEANRAYRAGDRLALEEVLTLWQEGEQGRAQRPMTGSAIDQIDRLRQRITQIGRELDTLYGSPLYELFVATAQARRQGRDLLREMTEQLDAQIAAASAALDESTA